MVKISENLLKRCTSSHLLNRGDKAESKAKDLLQITHLYLQEKDIHHIEQLETCPKLLALYLYENNITKIENVSTLRCLTCLYLQDNRIKKIENLEELCNLNILNLARNEIAVLEGLSKQTSLQQLWLENQKLPPETRFTFGSSSIHAMSNSLKLLNISGNRISYLRDLECLEVLEIFYLEDNNIQSLRDLVNSLSSWNKLSRLSLTGNDVCKERKYRDNIVVNCQALKELDGRPITQNYKHFLACWKESKLRSSRSSGEEKGNRFLEANIQAPQLRPAATLSMPNLAYTKSSERVNAKDIRETVSDENFPISNIH